MQILSAGLAVSLFLDENTLIKDSWWCDGWYYLLSKDVRTLCVMKTFNVANTLFSVQSASNETPAADDFSNCHMLLLAAESHDCCWEISS